MDNVKITIAEVQQTANLIRVQNEKLDHCLKDIHMTMKQLATYWQSPAQTTLQARFQALLPVFDNYHAIVSSYASFLDQTAMTYQNLEKQLQTGADQF